MSVTAAILVQKLFFARSKIDPINHRSSHTATASRTGGISIFLALSAASFYLYFLGEQPYDFSMLIPLSIMFIIGIYDDFYNADFKLKFFIQIIVAKILIDQGLVISNFYGVFGIGELPWILAQIFTVFVFLVIVNAVNFIDGIDGLALTVFLQFLLLFEWISSSDHTAVLSFILIVSALPLYYFNFRKDKKVFLGDAGSLLIGTLMSIYTFQLLNPTFQLSFLAATAKPYTAILLLLFPLFDLLRVFIIRIKTKKSPFQADKKHLHHVLITKFTSHFKVTLLIVGLSAFVQIVLLITILR